MTQARSTKAEVEQRTSEIHKLLLAGASRHNILQFAASKTAWNLKVRAIDNLISKASKAITTSAAFDRQLQVGLAIEQLRDIYSRSYRIQDFKTCLAVRKELSELLGLYAPKCMEVTGADGGPQQFIAIIPEPARSREEWSRECQAELRERERALESPTADVCTGAPA